MFDSLVFRGALLVLSAFALLGLPPSASADRRPRLQILNGSDQPVEVFWLENEDERRRVATIEPRRSDTVDTTIGHRFLIVGQKDRAEAEIVSRVPIQAFRFDPQGKNGVPAFYSQSISAGGYPIVGSAKVNPYALKEAAYLVDLMLARRPDVREAMIASGSRLCIMARDEFTTDLPEFAWLAKDRQREFPDLEAKDFWDARARGLGGSETDPYCSCAEENLLGFEGDPYSTENILIHEFAHNIHQRGMTNVDPTFDERLKETYESAMKAGLWKGKYAATNHHEYFAEGVQSWFDDNRENDHDHNHVDTRAELLEYDPGLAAMCREVFGETELSYVKPTERLTGHMAGYDPATAPAFEWPRRLEHAQQLIRRSAQERDAKAKGS
jgi:hypothetical protein